MGDFPMEYREYIYHYEFLKPIKNGYDTIFTKGSIRVEGGIDKAKKSLRFITERKRLPRGTKITRGKRLH